MKLQIFQTLWGQDAPLDVVVARAVEDGYDGVEGPAPSTPEARRAMRQHLDDADLAFSLEICTAGSYVPRRHATLDEHLESFAQQLQAIEEMRPLRVSSMAGCDAWRVAQNVEFFGAASRLAAQHGVECGFETHRGRSFFNPWTTRDVVRQLPDLKLTCDFSHWCVVCERLVDEETDVLQLCAERAIHIHARVGYDQGAQACDPAAPEYSQALHAHERWWKSIWQEQHKQGRELTTMTAEAGPDGYMQQVPYTQMPLADLRAVNRWMAHRQREQFAVFLREQLQAQLQHTQVLSMA